MPEKGILGLAVLREMRYSGLKSGERLRANTL